MVRISRQDYSKSCKEVKNIIIITVSNIITFSLGALSAVVSSPLSASVPSHLVTMSNTPLHSC